MYCGRIYNEGEYSSMLIPSEYLQGINPDPFKISLF
jgi:hypothetical protein